jgi:hypothetical protein
MMLTVGVIGMVVLVLGFGLFLGVERGERPGAELGRRPELVTAPSRFFATRPAAEVPVEFLLSQIEQHIRVEEAAAESFLYAPTAKSLHAPTASRLVN